MVIFKYFVHLKNNQNSNIVHKTQKDPTSGCMQDVTKLTFTPCDKVHPMTIFMFEIGIKKCAPYSFVSISISFSNFVIILFLNLFGT